MELKPEMTPEGRAFLLAFHENLIAGMNAFGRKMMAVADQILDEMNRIKPPKPL